MLFFSGDNRHIPRNKSSKSSTDGTVESILEIVFIEHTDDSVIYACTGNNSEGQMRDRVEIKIIGIFAI